jgi:NADH:ubiquinone oxidoreductase subunit
MHHTLAELLKASGEQRTRSWLPELRKSAAAIWSSSLTKWSHYLFGLKPKRKVYSNRSFQREIQRKMKHKFYHPKNVIVMNSKEMKIHGRLFIYIYNNTHLSTSPESSQRSPY